MQCSQIKTKGWRCIPWATLKIFSFIVSWALLLLTRSCCQYNYSFIGNFSSMIFLLILALYLLIYILYLRTHTFLQVWNVLCLFKTSVFPLPPTVLNSWNIYQVYVLFSLFCMSFIFFLSIFYHFISLWYILDQFLCNIFYLTGVQVIHWVRSL